MLRIITLQVLNLAFLFWNNIVIIHNTVISLCVSDIYLMMADLDSRPMLQCIKTAVLDLYVVLGRIINTLLKQLLLVQLPQYKTFFFILTGAQFSLQ